MTRAPPNAWSGRRVLPILAVLGQLALVACDDVVVNAPVGPQRFTDSDFVYASRNGEIETAVVGNPLGESPDFAAVVLEHMHNANRGRPVRFVAEPQNAGSAPYHVIVVFNHRPNLAADAACSRSNSTPTEPASESITLLAVFCNGAQALSSAIGTARMVETPQDRRFRSLVRQVTYALFPAYDQNMAR
jgi:hypothetical protein